MMTRINDSIERMKIAARVFTMLCVGSIFSALAGDRLQAQDKPFDVSQISESGGLVIAVRPKVIDSQPGFKPLTSVMSDGMEAEYGIRLDQIKQFVLQLNDPSKNFAYQMFLDLDVELEAERYLSALLRNGSIGKVEEVEHRGDKYLKAQLPAYAIQRRKQRAARENPDAKAKPIDDKIDPDDESNFFGLWQPSKTSVVVGPEASIKKLAANESSKQTLLKSKAWKQVETETVAAVFDAKVIDSFTANIPERMVPEEVATVSESMETASVGVDVGDSVSVMALVYCKSPTHSRKAKDAIEKLVELGKKLLKMQLANLDAKSPETSLFELLAELLNRAKITRNGNIIKLSASVKADAFLDSTMEATNAAKAAASRVQSANNGKMMGLAFHNYVAAHKKFPSAVLTGPKGHKYSWRVEILPFIGHKKLYDQYNFEEDWDSENNLKVLKQMPDSFRHPDAEEGSTSASYMALVGPGSLFWKEDTFFPDILDGTSNTIAYVEIKNDVPWTKPEDIAYDPFDPEDLALQLGGYSDEGFNAVFVDGAVKFISNQVDNAHLHSMIQISDKADAAKDE